MIGTRQKTEGLNSERLLKILRLSLGQIRPGGWQECSRIQTLTRDGTKFGVEDYLCVPPER